MSTFYPALEAGTSKFGSVVVFGRGCLSTQWTTSACVSGSGVVVALVPDVDARICGSSRRPGDVRRQYWHEPGCGRRGTGCGRCCSDDGRCRSDNGLGVGVLQSGGLLHVLG